MLTVGIDIGGMSAKIGLVKDGLMLGSKKVKTLRENEMFFGLISAGVVALLNEFNFNISDVKGVGVGCPGSVTAETGVVEFANNLGWEKVDVGGALSRRLGLPVRIANDANVAALGEAKYGAGKNYKNTVMVTLGTGVGGGIVIDGKLYEGGGSKGGELGHTTLVYGGIPCNCGRSGCAECYCSATALVRETKKAMLENQDSLMWEYCFNKIQNADGTTACECAKKGDKVASMVYSKYVEYLSEFLMNIFNVFRPDALIIGGGISNHGEYLLDKIRLVCEHANYGYKGAPKVDIICAELGNDAGIYGAAALVE